MPLDSSQHINVIHLVAKGDDAALAKLIDLYSGALLGSILNVVGSKEIADEILQDVFLKIWHQAASYDADKAKPFTWMLRIARNSAIDYRRSAQFSKASKTDAIDSSVYNNEMEEPIFIEPKLNEALAKLPNEQQDVLKSVYLEGYSHSEVSDLFQIPLGTVKTRVRNGLISLRRWLGDV